VQQNREQHVRVSLNHLKHTKGLPPACRCVDRHEEGTVNTTSVRFFHSEELLLVILLHVVRHLWLSCREHTPNSSLQRRCKFNGTLVCLAMQWKLSLLVSTLSIALNLTISTGFEGSVPNLYRHDTQRNRASRSAQPETEKGTPCVARLKPLWHHSLNSIMLHVCNDTSAFAVNCISLYTWVQLPEVGHGMQGT